MLAKPSNSLVNQLGAFGLARASRLTARLPPQYQASVYTVLPTLLPSVRAQILTQKK
ncbi:MAG: hypothetical protein HC817_15400 [Saprospiraceae bacterium]|nr:hypothetical protein [Saprospiraceae bacterium]